MVGTKDVLSQYVHSGVVATNSSAPVIDARSGDTSTQSAQFTTSYVQYEQFVLNNRRGNLEWQLLETKIIFVVVIFIVLSGILASIAQFIRDITIVRGRSSKAGNSNTTHLKISLSGLEIQSSVIGLLILAISLAFFFLYLKFVYPIVQLAPRN